MEIEVLLFASLADVLGRASVRAQIGPETTAAALITQLARDFPALGPSLRHARVAADARFLAAGEKVLPAREIALIPPVSGG